MIIINWYVLAILIVILIMLYVLLLGISYRVISKNLILNSTETLGDRLVKPELDRLQSILNDWTQGVNYDDDWYSHDIDVMNEDDYDDDDILYVSVLYANTLYSSFFDGLIDISRELNLGVQILKWNGNELNVTIKFIKNGNYSWESDSSDGI